MSQQELLKRVVQVLNEQQIPYMATGSVVSSSQGEPRASHDIDLILSLSPPSIPALLAAFPPPSYYLSKEAIEDALRSRTMFNLLALDEGDKVDFWMLTDEPFDQTRFARKRVETVWGIELVVSSPEDTILAKLRWALMSGGSEKQFHDSLRVYEVQRPTLNEEYIAHWVAQLGLGTLWEQVKSQSESP
jgi:hypothetical protein